MNTVNCAAQGTLSGLLCGVKATDNRREFPIILRFCGERNESGGGTCLPLEASTASDKRFISG